MSCVGLALLVLVSSSCTLKERRDYVITLSLGGFYSTIFMIPTITMVVFAWDARCGRNIDCAMDIIKANSDMDGFGAAEWYFSLDNKRSEWQQVFTSIRDSGHVNLDPNSPAYLTSDCAGLHVNYFHDITPIRHEVGKYECNA